MRGMLLTVLCAGALVACAPPQQAELTSAQLVERGEYLVERVVLCGDCHTPMLEGGAGWDESRKLQGAPINVPPGGPLAEYAPAIAGGPENYTDEQLISFIQTGVRPDGSHPRPPMPPYRLNEEDARAVAAYIKTLPRAAQ